MDTIDMTTTATAATETRLARLLRAVDNVVSTIAMVSSLPLGSRAVEVRGSSSCAVSAWRDAAEAAHDDDTATAVWAARAALRHAADALKAACDDRESTESLARYLRAEVR